MTPARKTTRCACGRRVKVDEDLDAAGMVAVCVDCLAARPVPRSALPEPVAHVGQRSTFKRPPEPRPSPLPVPEFGPTPPTVPFETASSEHEFPRHDSRMD